jgi:uncharacterized membrane protein (DUF373 family)
MKKKMDYLWLDKTAKIFEVAIAVLLLFVIAVKIIEVILALSEIQVVIIGMEFDRFLSISFTLVIGVEFTKMLCKHTPETVIDVLLFAIARQTVIYHKSTTDLLVGSIAIAGLFAAKRFFLKWDRKKKETHDEKTPESAD